MGYEVGALGHRGVWSGVHKALGYAEATRERRGAGHRGGSLTSAFWSFFTLALSFDALFIIVLLFIARFHCASHSFV